MCAVALWNPRVKPGGLVAITLLFVCLRICCAGTETQPSDDAKLSSDDAAATLSPVLSAIENLAALNETENEAEKFFNKMFSKKDFPVKNFLKKEKKDHKLPKCSASSEKNKKCILNRSTRSTTVAGNRTPSISRAFVSLHVPQIQTIKSNSLSVNDKGKSDPGAQTSKNNDSEWKDRLRNMLDPSKATIKIFVFERPGSNRGTRKTQVTSAFPSFDSWRRRADLNLQSKVRSLSDKTKRTVVHHPNIERAQLVFSKDVRGYSPLLQNLLSKTNSVSKSNLVTAQTFHLNQGRTTTPQHVVSPPATTSNEIKTSSFGNIFSPAKSTNFAGPNPHAFNVQRIPPVLSFSSSDIFYPSLPDLSLRDSSLVNPSFTATSPSKNLLFPKLFPSRIPTNKVKSPMERSFQSEGLHSTLSPAKSQAEEIPPKPTRLFHSEISQPLNPIPKSESTSNNFKRLDISPAKQNSSSRSCGICEYFDSSAGTCLLDTCCPLRLAGISGVSC